MAQIQTILNQIKNAIYGRDVRQAIHDGIKKAYDDASENDNANMEVKMARGNHNVLNDRLEDIEKTTKDNKDDVRIELNKKRDKNQDIQMGDLSQEVKEAMTGGSVAVVGPDSVGNINIKNEAVSVDKLEFTIDGKGNLFDGAYFNGMLFSNTSTTPNSLIPVYDYDNFIGKIAIVPIEKNTDYSLKIFEPEKSDRFRLGLSETYPQFKEKGSDLTVAGPIPSEYEIISKTLSVNNSNTEFTFNSESNNYMILYVDGRGNTPKLRVVKGVDVPTEYKSGKLISDEYVDKNIFIEDLRITKNLSDNLFDGTYTRGVLFSNTSTAPNSLIPVYNYSTYDGKLAIVKIEKNKHYTIKVYEPEKSNRFRVGLSKLYVGLQVKGEDLTIAGDVPSNYNILDTFITSINNELTEVSFGSEDNEWAYVYVDGEGNEPDLWIGEGSAPTEFTNNIVIDPKYIDYSHIIKDDEYPDEVAKSRFIEEMNLRAEEIGMNNTNFVEPAGFPAVNDQYSTSRDMLRLGIIASGYREMAKVWNKKTYEIKVKGPNERIININTTVKDTDLEEDYYIFGGKTGSISNGDLKGYHLVVITDGPDDNWLITSVRGADSLKGRFTAAKIALDNAVKSINGESDIIEVNNAESVSCALVPKHNVFSYEDYDFDLLYTYQSDNVGHMASTTKIMTGVVLLDNIYNLNERIAIKESDITAGTGNVFQAGDIVRLKDLLYAMMLPSSNTAAYAIARYVGNKIINQQN